MTERFLGGSFAAFTVLRPLSDIDIVPRLPKIEPTSLSLKIKPVGLFLIKPVRLSPEIDVVPMWFSKTDTAALYDNVDVAALFSMVDMAALSGAADGYGDNKTGRLSSSQEQLSDCELAAMLTTIVFLLVYISLSFVAKNYPQVADISRTDGPTPFEAAMAVGALVFWVTYSRRRSS